MRFTQITFDFYLKWHALMHPEKHFCEDIQTAEYMEKAI